MKPTYEELKGFVNRLHDVDCDSLNCEECVLFFPGFCREMQELTQRLKNADEEEEN